MPKGFRRPPPGAGRPIRRPGQGPILPGIIGPPKPPSQPPTTPGQGGEEDGEFVPGSPTRPDLYPDMWVYNRENSRGFRLSPERQLADAIRRHIPDSNRWVRLAFRIEGDLPDKDNYEIFGQSRQIGARMYRESLLRRLDSGESLTRIVERERGYPDGTITRITEYSVAESVHG